VRLLLLSNGTVYAGAVHSTACILANDIKNAD